MSLPNLSDGELQVFRSRVIQAMNNGYDVGAGSQFDQLKNEVGAVASPNGVEGSPDHLLALVSHAMAMRAGTAKKVRPPKPEPVVEEAPKAKAKATPKTKKEAPAPKPKAEKPKKKAAPKKSNDPTFHEMTREELRKWATDFEVAGRGSMSRDELVTVMRREYSKLKRK